MSGKLFILSVMRNAIYVKKGVAAVFAALFSTAVCLASEWKPVGDKIKTPWADKIDVNNVLPEYPRPIMEREKWLNLNGLWDYAVRPANSSAPEKFDGKILVPFAIESALSGVGKKVEANDNIWYSRTFEIPSDWRGQNVLINFGAVDCIAEVFVNGKSVGSHTGGYAPFSFDITKHLKDGQNNLLVKVNDPTDGFPRGKQISKPRGIFYTSVSGIWQTVWLEPVPKSHIKNIKITPDLDASSFDVKVDSGNPSATAEIKILDGGKVVSSAKVASSKTASLLVENPKLWSPDSPFLYDVVVTLNIDGKVADTVKSYAAMRKISLKKRADKVAYIQLNNKDIFMFGPLDQGWWPDGLYTAPTDEALAFDIVETKKLGFNTIRKHVKVEPARWYAHCDRLGVIVWQDMPSAFGKGFPQNRWQQWSYFKGEEKVPSAEFEANFRKEWREIMDALHSYPCIAVWVPFNEAWGQFKTAEICEWTKNYDPSRLVNPASGGNFFLCGDILDLHRYPRPFVYLFDCDKANVIGEYGGIGFVVDGHIWSPDKNWGYVRFKSSDEVTAEYLKYVDDLVEMSGRGVCGAIYTQTTDVEGEINGIFTYDRKVLKMDRAKISEANKKLSDIFKK